ncbi:hypothetical protein [Streptomyces cacaoi]
MSWLATVAGLAFACWAGSLLGNNFYADVYLVMAAGMAFATFGRRIMSSRVILGKDFLSVVNPILSYRVPYERIAKITRESSGTLLVVTLEGKEIASTGFGGSFLDYFVGSTDKAVHVIDQQVRKRRKSAGIGEVPTIRYSWDPVADLSALGILVCLLLWVITGR